MIGYFLHVNLCLGTTHSQLSMETNSSPREARYSVSCREKFSSVCDTSCSGSKYSVGYFIDIDSWLNGVSFICFCQDCKNMNCCMHSIMPCFLCIDIGNDLGCTYMQLASVTNLIDNSMMQDTSGLCSSLQDSITGCSVYNSKKAHRKF